MQKKVVIFFIDGGTWNLLDPWIRDGQLPNFAYVKNSGVSGIMESTIPPSTAPAIQAFHTGKNPGNLGIFNVFKEDGSVVSFNDVHEKTIWEALGENGFRSLIVELPTTYPVRPFNGVMITGFLTPSSESEFTYPPELKERLKDYPAGEEYDHSTSLKVDNWRHVLDSIIDISQKRFRAFVGLFKEEDPDFSIFYVKSTDVLGHLFWERREHLLEYYKILDDELGQIIQLAGELADIFVLSDHGFEDAAQYAFHINSWLAEEGYFPKRPSLKYRLYSWLDKHKGIKKLARQLMAVLGRDLEKRKKELQKTVAKKSLAYFDGIFGLGVRISPYMATENPEITNEIIGKLKNLSHQGKKVFKIVDRRENIYHGPHTQKAPDIVFLPSKEFMVYGGIDKKVFGLIKNRVRKGDHGSAYEAIFMAAGPDITRRSTSDRIKITDIFPTILEIFGITGVDSDGKAIELK